jgi:hypothetical protein
VGQRLRVAFKWQGGYGAFTVSPYHVEKVRNYVLHQPEHHAAGNTHSSLELLTAEQNRAGPSAA